MRPDDDQASGLVTTPDTTPETAGLVLEAGVVEESPALEWWW
jgi:hypothetical protein